MQSEEESNHNSGRPFDVEKKSKLGYRRANPNPQEHQSHDQNSTFAAAAPNRGLVLSILWTTQNLKHIPKTLSEDADNQEKRIPPSPPEGVGNHSLNSTASEHSFARLLSQ